MDNHLNQKQMNDFFPGQRWSSEGEPELGIGIIIDTSNGRVQVHFPAAGENRQYTAENAPLRRAAFKVGDTVANVEGNSLHVEQVSEESNLLMYHGKEGVISEVNLGEVALSHGVEERLLRGEIDPPALFSLRRKTLHYDHARRISPINGFVGGRIDLIPHQLYIAHEVSARHAPRVLLSDQVGLGKTIEACLILHRLLQNGRISRVLILVPDSLVHQWFVEMLRRFNLWFHIFDEARCLALDGTAPEGNPFLDDQWVICSVDFLAGSQLRTMQALSAGWDMLVVDEAHHLEWSVEQASPEYLLVELLSKAANGLLLLTATPEQLGAESHFARLHLLDPDRYADYETFKNESQDYSGIANIVEKLASGAGLKVPEKQLLEFVAGKERVDALAAGSTDELIEELLDQHGPGRVIFRNTRSAMQNFPKRLAKLIPLKASDPATWKQRLSAEFEQDQNDNFPQGKNKTDFQFSEDPRVKWLGAFLEETTPAKVLLICRTKEKVLALEKALETLTAVKCGVFHEDLTIVQRDRNAAWFTEPKGARLLLCSEIGSEGRNFQFAHQLVLFDLPPHPELLEQRIGRLDRIGQTEDIHIHIPYLEGSPQAALTRWYHEGLNAFEENVEGGNQYTLQFHDRLQEITRSTSSSNTSTTLEKLIADTVTFRKKLKQLFEKGRDRLLEMNSFRPKKAEQLVAQIAQADKDTGLEGFLTQVFHQFSIEMEDLAARTYRLRPSRMNDEAFPAIPDEGISVTFERKRALSREDVSFISWDHPMATGALDMVLSKGTGAASFGTLRGTGKTAILLEVLFVLETSGGQHLHVDRFLPATPLRVVVSHTGEEVTAAYSVTTFDQHVRPGKVVDLLENETLTEVIFPNMLKAATEAAENRKSAEIENGLAQMEQTLNREIARLISLQKKNDNIRPEELELALTEKQQLSERIEKANIRMDALMLVKEG